MRASSSPPTKKKKKTRSPASLASSSVCPSVGVSARVNVVALERTNERTNTETLSISRDLEIGFVRIEALKRLCNRFGMFVVSAFTCTILRVLHRFRVSGGVRRQCAPGVDDDEDGKGRRDGVLFVVSRAIGILR